MSDYSAFLDRKAQIGSQDGFTPTYLPGFLFEFQRDLVSWAVEQGRAAIFADCGLGKTPIQLVWLGRRAVGMEIKPSYYRQAIKNLEAVDIPESHQVAMAGVR